MFFLRKKQSIYEDIFKKSSNPIAIADNIGNIIEKNSSFLNIYSSNLLSDILSNEQWAILIKNDFLHDEIFLIYKNDKKYLIFGDNKASDDIITEQKISKKSEDRIAHSQKMQAVGQLAGGVAHDFNNLLTAMIGFCDLLLMRHNVGDPSFADIMQIKQNANRAAGLVRQLLAFSRRQTLTPKILDVTEVIAEVSHLISRLIGENIKLEVFYGRDLGMVKADQGQLEQVIINLCVNARDAMLKTGGKLTIKTSNILINDENNISNKMLSPPDEDKIPNGKYVLIEVADSGSGIDENLVAKIFEPFFSTKEIGKGTGLGLATVHGIIKQSGGYLYLETAKSEGTKFYIFLPFSNEKEEINTKKDREKTISDLTGTATILLVEDESSVRNFAKRALQNKGYVIIEADSGESGLEFFAENKGNIDIILTDVIMPIMNGSDMVKQLRALYPTELKRCRIIFMSGYTEDIFDDGFLEEGNCSFLQKPFTLQQLAEKIKDFCR